MTINGLLFGIRVLNTRTALPVGEVVVAGNIVVVTRTVLVVAGNIVVVTRTVVVVAGTVVVEVSGTASDVFNVDVVVLVVDRFVVSVMADKSSPPKTNDIGCDVVVMTHDGQSVFFYRGGDRLE